MIGITFYLQHVQKVVHNVLIRNEKPTIIVTSGKELTIIFHNALYDKLNVNNFKSVIASSDNCKSCFYVYRYSSGGEDGYIRLHNLDSQYFDFEFEY